MRHLSRWSRTVRSNIVSPSRANPEIGTPELVAGNCGADAAAALVGLAVGAAVAIIVFVGVGGTAEAVVAAVAVALAAGEAACTLA